jgi:hypothetical protein
MTLEEITLLARCNGMHTMTFRASEDKDSFNSEPITWVSHNLLDHSPSHQNCTSKSCGQVNCNQKASECYQPFINNFDLKLFRTMILACSSLPEMYCILNFGREVLEQTGTGHFACLGGYNEDEDKVLILDTARYKYPPFWVDVQWLYKSL